VGINPVQSRFGFLRENSQIYWVRELGDRVFGERGMRMGDKEHRGGNMERAPEEDEDKRKKKS
jgi:hypothetical protein